MKGQMKLGSAVRRKTKIEVSFSGSMIRDTHNKKVSKRLTVSRKTD